MLDGKPMDDPFGEKRGVFRYDSLLKRLKAIKHKLEAKKKDEEEGGKSAMEVEISNVDQSTTIASNMDTEKKEEIPESQPMDTDIQTPQVGLLPSNSLNSMSKTEILPI